VSDYTETAVAAAPVEGAAATTTTAETPPAAPDGPQLSLEPRRGGRRAVRRIAIGIAVTVAVLATLAALLYSFGGMARPAPEMRAAYDRLVTDGRVAALESRFVIPIPGCRCHSADPVVTMQHSGYRIRDCRASGCHG
jgi:hypothetical protein